jgi:hypothetical protein
LTAIGSCENVSMMASSRSAYELRTVRDIELHCD